MARNWGLLAGLHTDGRRRDLYLDTPQTDENPYPINSGIRFTLGDFSPIRPGCDGPDCFPVYAGFTMTGTIDLGPGFDLVGQGLLSITYSSELNVLRQYDFRPITTPEPPTVILLALAPRRPPTSSRGKGSRPQAPRSTASSPC
jgi:hypothetical protein